MRCLVWFALAASVLTGCKSKRTEPPPVADKATARPPKDELFVIARVTMTREAVPARFAAPIPSTVDGLRARDAYAPESYIRAMLRSNGAGMRGRLVDAITRAAAQGAVAEDLADWYANVFGYYVSGEPCTWLTQMATKAAPAVRDVFSRMLVRCRSTDALPLITRDETPDAVVVDWFFERIFEDALPYNERAARAAAAIGRSSSVAFDVRKVGFVFARMGGAESVAKLVELQKSIPDPERRARIAVGMLASNSPAGRAIGRKACRHPVIAKDAMCESREEDKPRAPTGVDELVRDPYDDNLAALDKLPRDDVIVAARRCTATAEVYERRGCFSLLATYDRPAAVELARGLAGDPATEGAWLTRAAQVLVAFPEAGAVERHVAKLGFTARPGVTAARGPAPLTVEDVLFASGRMTNFDVETGQFPNEHDTLLADLAVLAEPALAGVVFEEIPPRETEIDSGRYELRAYFDGLRYAVPAENHGDWYDVEATLGLLNAILVARKSDVRFTVLPTGDQTANVLAGPAKGIRALVDAKLVELGDPAESEATGKEFENRVFEQIQGSADGEVIRDPVLTR